MVFALLIVATALPIVALVLLVLRYGKAGSPVVFGLVIGIAMSGIAFGLYNISEYSDLTKYMDQAMLTQGLSIGESLNLFSRGHMKDTPLAIIWFWAIGLTGNAQWYPASIAFVEYSIIGYILTDYAKEAGYDRKQYALVLALMILTVPLFNSVTSVRSTPALAIAFLGFYLDFCKHIRNPLVYLLYVIPIFIHALAVILIPVRILCQLGVKRPALAVATTVLLLPAAYIFADALNPIFLRMGSSIMHKVLTYVSNSDSEYAQHVLGSTFLQTRKWVSILLSLFALHFLLRELREADGNGSPLHKALCLGACMLNALIISFGLVVVVPSYTRLVYITHPISALIITKRLPFFDASTSFRWGRNSECVLMVLYILLIFAHFALTLYELPRRVAVAGLAWHVLFGFFGALFV